VLAASTLVSMLGGIANQIHSWHLTTHPNP
jgi:hypothetical protein